MKNPNAALAGSYDFMHLMGHVCLGLMWARMAKAAYAALDAGAGDRDFYEAKIATGPLLHGAPAARDGDAPGADRDRGRDRSWRLTAEAF